MARNYLKEISLISFQEQIIIFQHRNPMTLSCSNLKVEQSLSLDDQELISTAKSGMNFHQANLELAKDQELFQCQEILN